MVSFEIFVKSMTPGLLELKVTPSFCFPFKIPDDSTATNVEVLILTTGLVWRKFVPVHIPECPSTSQHQVKS